MNRQQRRAEARNAATRPPGNPAPVTIEQQKIMAAQQRLEQLLNLESLLRKGIEYTDLAPEGSEYAEDLDANWRKRLDGVLLSILEGFETLVEAVDAEHQAATSLIDLPEDDEVSIVEASR